MSPFVTDLVSPALIPQLVSGKSIVRGTSLRFQVRHLLDIYFWTHHLACWNLNLLTCIVKCIKMQPIHMAVVRIVYE